MDAAVLASIVALCWMFAGGVGSAGLQARVRLYRNNTTQTVTLWPFSPGFPEAEAAPQQVSVSPG